MRVAQWVKTGDWGLIPRGHRVEGETQLLIFLIPSCKHLCIQFSRIPPCGQQRASEVGPGQRTATLAAPDELSEATWAWSSGASVGVRGEALSREGLSGTSPDPFACRVLERWIWLHAGCALS